MKKIVISNGPLETKKLATLFKANLQKGDVVLLKGEIGAGKSHFARSLIQSAMYIKEEVPSPTFTLVQVYDTTIGSIWHADLYRLNDYSDVIDDKSKIRSSTGLAVDWLTPIGPLTLSFAKPITKSDTDKTETFRFDIGTTF